MLDLQFIRDNADLVKQGAKNKGLNPDVVDKALQLDKKWRELLGEVERVRSERNALNREMKKSRTDEMIQQSKDLKSKLQNMEPELKQVESTLQTILLQIPNVPDKDVPVGEDESGNVEVAQWGDKPKFDFEPLDHIELGLKNGLIDLERGSKVAGYRGYYLKGKAVQLNMGIMRYALDRLVEKGFTPMIPPIINRKEAFVNSGHFPWGEREAYAMYREEEIDADQITALGASYKNADLNTRSDMYLAGTAEVPLVSFHAGETLTEQDLPKLYCGFSPCYRREVGSYGRDTRGIYRVHEFMKIEQVILCVADMEESYKWHEKLRSYAEEMLQELGLHYRVLLMCTGDMGEPQVKKYDIETWMPGREAYGETMSDSIMGDFQSRRANIRYQDKDGKLKFVHMLNNTALASTRILIALWEHYQQKDGSILLPEVLHDYVGFKRIEAE